MANSSPLGRLVELQIRKERDAADRLAISSWSHERHAALMEPDRYRFEHGGLAGLITKAQATIRVALDQAKHPMIAFSGGKDSICTMALVHSVDPSVPLVWSDDELEYPEIVSYMRALYIVSLDDPADFIWLQGGSVHAGWFRPWSEEPFFREPDSRMLWLNDGQEDMQDWSRDEGYDLTFLGVRMGESRRRRDRLAADGSITTSRRGTRLHCTPVMDWTEADIWALIAGWDLPYPRTYDRLAEVGVPRDRQRIGPLPLARREDLLVGWPDLLVRLEERYGFNATRWPAGE